MEKVAPNSKFVGHSTEIIRQSKIKEPLTYMVLNTKIYDSNNPPFKTERQF